MWSDERRRPDVPTTRLSVDASQCTDQSLGSRLLRLERWSGLHVHRQQSETSETRDTPERWLVSGLSKDSQLTSSTHFRNTPEAEQILPIRRSRRVRRVRVAAEFCAKCFGSVRLFGKKRPSTLQLGGDYESLGCNEGILSRHATGSDSLLREHRRPLRFSSASCSANLVYIGKPKFIHVNITYEKREFGIFDFSFDRSSHAEKSTRATATG